VLRSFFGSGVGINGIGDAKTDTNEEGKTKEESEEGFHRRCPHACHCIKHVKTWYTVDAHDVCK
jgi:hypothetical protein